MASADTAPFFENDIGPEPDLTRNVTQWAERQERQVIFGLGDGDFRDARGDQGLIKKFARLLTAK
ncbi:hypothetical protein BGZ72_002475, partial [Mortierella alpina]